MGDIDPFETHVRIYFDVEITRRKRFHLVTDLEDNVLFRCKLASDALQYVVQQGFYCVSIRGLYDRWSCLIAIEEPPKEH